MSNLPGSNKEKAIKNFWLRHYRYGQHEVSDRKLKVDEVYDLFKITNKIKLFNRNKIST